MASYFDNFDLTALFETRIDANISFDWGRGAPILGMGIDTFSARWTGYLVSSFTEPYTFYVSAADDDTAQVWIDGTVTSWTTYSGSFNMIAGEPVSIRCEYHEGQLNAAVTVRWSSPSTPLAVIPQEAMYSSLRLIASPSPTRTVSLSTSPSPSVTATIAVNLPTGTGWSAQYYANADLTALFTTRYDPVISFNWPRGSEPIPGMGVNTFSARWSGFIVSPVSELVTFEVRCDAFDGNAQLWLDGSLVSWSTYDGSVNMTAGEAVSIRVEYHKGQGAASVSVSWRSLSMPLAVVPQAAVWADVRQVTTPSYTGTNTPTLTMTASQTPTVAIRSEGDGWSATYFYQRIFTVPVLTRTDAVIAFSWGRAAPVAGLPVDEFSVRWRGFIRIPYSENFTFQLTVSNSDDAKLWIEDALVVDARRSPVGTIALNSGVYYSIRVEFQEQNLDASISAFWSSPSVPFALIPTVVVWSDVRSLVSPTGTPSQTATTTMTSSPTPSTVIAPTGTGWLGRYYRFREWSDQFLVATRIDAAIDFHWAHGSPPFSALGNDLWSVRWTGFVMPPVSGNITFYLAAADEARLYIEDILIVESRNGYTGSANLVGGQHVSMRVDFLQSNVATACVLQWSHPLIPLQVIPTAYVWWDVHQVTSPSITPSNTPTASMTVTPTSSVGVNTTGFGWRCVLEASTPGRTFRALIHPCVITRLTPFP